MRLNGINATVKGCYRPVLPVLFMGILWVIAICCFVPIAARAHGALLEYRQVPGIIVQAKYDNGMPMAQAQMTVYAPDNPTAPWLIGTGDEQGLFSFVPHPDLPGTWSIQARQAGHGAMIHIVVGDDPQPKTLVTTSPSLLQRLFMAGAVVWGFIGTALYFSRRRPS